MAIAPMEVNSYNSKWRTFDDTISRQLSCKLFCRFQFIFLAYKALTNNLLDHLSSSRYPEIIRTLDKVDTTPEWKDFSCSLIIIKSVNLDLGNIAGCFSL
ncbi:hypothetical protein CEXT_360321 [Caerostris extrusa]|uniref:Uncharacterized protein n=1 Tax=Caerostris extrusa TaxID=172846 RepID=A0AAV4WFY5_CAEEX|nr:hypothetical protein CEXT_360321 [Caerostris extrusa]